MVKGTALFRNAHVDITVQISQPAQKLIGLENVSRLVSLLTELLEMVEAKSAYIGKDGPAITIYIHSAKWGNTTWRIHKNEAENHVGKAL